MPQMPVDLSLQMLHIPYLVKTGVVILEVDYLWYFAQRMSIGGLKENTYKFSDPYNYY